MTEYSDDQVNAIDGLMDALTTNSGSAHRPLRLTGAAGTGKTQVLSGIAHNPTANPIVLTPTNKAAYVLRQRGVPALTIHSQIYAPVHVALKEELRALKESRIGDEADPGKDAEIAALEAKLQKTPNSSRMEFSFRPDNKLRGNNVLIDEASMVGQRVLGDILLSHPRRVVLCGDRNQLQPVSDAPILQDAEPDFELTRNHRSGDQERLSELAELVLRAGPDEALAAARNASNADPAGPVRVYGRGANHPDKAALAQAVGDGNTIWLCWRNTTRLKINHGIRRIMGYGRSSIVHGEMLVAYARDPEDMGRWFNGCPATVLDVEMTDVPLIDGFTMESYPARRCQLSIDGVAVNDVDIARRDLSGYNPDDHRPTWQYGYCLTVQLQ